MTIVRIATVPYVNAAPLVWGFRHGPERLACALVAAPPARIPGMLLDGTADAGLIPVIEAPRLAEAGITLLPSPGIASRHAARSVLLVGRRPIEEVRRIALDRSSRSSAALLKILLDGRGIGPVAFDERPPVLPAMLESHDAALIIGDPALAADTRGLHVYDLATEWHAMTGLPFVFAAWAIRPDAVFPGGVRLFEASLRAGLQRIDAVAAEAAPAIGIPAAAVAAYLRDNIHYELGPEEQRAMDLFFSRARALGLIGRPVPAHDIGVTPSAAVEPKRMQP